jgi:hypothetical protein
MDCYRVVFPGPFLRHVEMSVVGMEDRLLSIEKQYQSFQDENASDAGKIPIFHGFTVQSKDKQRSKSG